MASRLHRTIQFHLREHPDAVFTTVQLFELLIPDADLSDRIARTSFSRTLRSLRLPDGWRIEAPADPTRPHVIYNAESPESVKAAAVLL